MRILYHIFWEIYMKNFKFTAFLLILTIVASLYLPSTYAAALDDPAPQAASALLVDADSGYVFYSKNETAQVDPASTTKIMTVLLAVEAVERGEVLLTETVTATANCLYDITADSSTQNIQPGEEMTFSDLLYCALVASANEACNIIAERVSGSIPAFIQLMNDRAAELGCTGTHFANTHGLTNENHYTTAWDLYLIANEALKHDQFMTIANTTSHVVPATNMSNARELTTTNRLLLPNADEYYEYAAGMKTGHTSAAGYCLVSTAEKDDMQVISVLMGCDATIAENGTSQSLSFSETSRMFEWVFNNFSYQTILSTSDLIAQVPVALAEGTDSVIARPATDLSIVLPNDADLSQVQRDVVIFSQEEGAEPLEAPIESGLRLGTITISYDGVTYGPISLVANSDVSLSKIMYIRQQISNIFGQTWVKVLLIALVVLLVLYIAFVIRYNILRRRRQQQYPSRYTGRGKSRRR